MTTIRDLEGIGQKFPALSFMGGPSMGQLHLLKEGEHVVGRSKEASIVVLDDAISRQHFRLIVKNGQVEIEDLSSTNGTFVNGVRVTRQLLHDKDTLQISSQTVMAFSYVTDLEAQKQTQIYKMANYDPVTQARTKYYFLDQIDQEFSHAKRKNIPLSLIIFDIDFFKKVNDTYGHPAGDFVLKKISDMTHQVIRTEDLFARYGGEEFVILMRETREEDAIRLADRLRQLIAHNPFEFEESRFKVTISAGVACSVDGNFKNFDEMIKAADQYLYFAKQNGRNRVASFSLLSRPK
ncbi:MAG: GGDEF domain-containing protein [bacterium]